MTVSPPRLFPAVLLCLLACLALPIVARAQVTCEDCRRRINGRYINSNGHVYCEACFQKRLPTCATCGKKVSGQHVISEGKAYCDKACFAKILPHCEVCDAAVEQALIVNGHYYCKDHKDLPRCASCSLPHARGFPLGDGRQLCQTCKPRAVMTDAVAARVYRQAVADVKAITGFQSPTVPPVKLVDSLQLQRLRQPDQEPRRDGKAIERGLYMRLENITETTQYGRKTRDVKITETIYVLNGLHPSDLIVVMAHELTHDLVAEQYPQVAEAPAWVQEGLCQYIAAGVCRRYKAPNTLRAIEEMPDDTYGGGYRYFDKKFGPGNWPGVVAWLRSTDFKRLPANAPQ